MPEPRDQPAEPVSAADVSQAVALAAAAMRQAEAADWHVPAGTLDWDCWETAEHMSDDLFAYAAQLGPRNPALQRPVPFGCAPRRPGGPATAIYADPEAGPEGLRYVFEAAGALLVAMVATWTAQADTGERPFGVADPDCFAAAAGVVEVLVHTHDITQGLDIPWQPPDETCRRALARQFPDAPTDSEPWPTLLWATGRGELPGRPAVTSWHWYPGPT